ncbi:hypothetical protein HMPREF3159_13835 [Brachybacterium sp. HMSC06H03]|uniref:hypothetical protein n=1 Tax=Brachybacterium sp. HMSC06H03 TaxID=1581127 RepID=UPI0008A451E5|nr:hypothetical protein [Brachybacterium sp. HMSC06H03]OFT47760.1 hypothetical protein HMPREF3159_13835 [Brachybacterium sp. HMSC06H03]
MTSPHSRTLPPLTDLPSPPRLPEEETHLVSPGEIMVESRREILRSLLRRLWAPALVLLGLWYVLLTLYVVGASPTFWFFSLLAGLGDPAYVRQAMSALNFTSEGLWTAFLLLPAVATMLSLLGALLVPRLVAPLQPRRFLSETQFQRGVEDRTTAMLLALPVLTVLALPLTVVLGLPQPWTGLGAGPLSVWCAGLVALELAWVLVRRTVPAARLLRITSHEVLHTEARIGTDPERRRAAARQHLAQDRRHLPPNPGTPAADGARSPRGALTALALIARSALTWVLPALAGTSWLVLGIADLVTVLGSLSATGLSQVETPLRWQHLAVGLPLLVLVAAGCALAPALAVPLSSGHRAQVRDQRTYAEWAHRARVNPWEARVCALTGWLCAGWALAGTILAAILLPLLGAGTALTWVFLTLLALMVVPLLGVAATQAMKSGLRDVLYGPPGDFMRRQTPYALVAPEFGTRADRAKDPAVRAALRKRLQADGGDHALEIFDLDAAGERLWVDENAPGASGTAVRQADLAQGVLPDFGSEGSAFTGGGNSPSEQASHLHDIPDTVTGLRER